MWEGVYADGTLQGSLEGRAEREGHFGFQFADLDRRRGLSARRGRWARPTVTKWRLYDPVFQGALNQRGAEVWGSGCDRIRSLLLKALDTLGEIITAHLFPRVASGPPPELPALR